MNPTLIDLKLPRSGFYKFISSWIFEHSGSLFIVDPGPTNSLEILYKALGERTPDYILLTHIHVDHAGGIGHISKKYPDAKIIAHEKAHRHLVNPEKLIEASRKTLGSLMDLYGEIVSINEECILKEPEKIEGLKIVETPGHARHHISFVFEEVIFCGEALGVTFPMDDGIYLRPATPPVFDLKSYLASIDSLEGVYTNQALSFGHYGYGARGVDYFRKAREQIELWCRVVKSKTFSKDLSPFSQEKFKETLTTLVGEDLNLQYFDKLPSDVQERELIFISNSIKGIICLD